MIGCHGSARSRAWGYVSAGVRSASESTVARRERPQSSRSYTLVCGRYLAQLCTLSSQTTNITSQERVRASAFSWGDTVIDARRNYCSERERPICRLQCRRGSSILILPTYNLISCLTAPGMSLHSLPAFLRSLIRNAACGSRGTTLSMVLRPISANCLRLIHQTIGSESMWKAPRGTPRARRGRLEVHS